MTRVLAEKLVSDMTAISLITQLTHGAWKGPSTFLKTIPLEVIPVEQF